jgi:1,4-dihydroxy-2-naphthoate octaprenyltransferase
MNGIHRWRVLPKNKAQNMANNPEDKKKAVDQSISKVKESYQSIDKKLAIKEEDSTLILIGKILLRLLLIVVMVLLSPFLVIGLIFALMAAL